MELEELPGIGETTAEKLKEAGFNTIESIAVANPVEIKEVGGIGEAVAA